jgi:hypothetical protein
MTKDLRDAHQKQLAALRAELAGNTQKIRVKKKTISNLFRYGGRKVQAERWVDLSRFNKPLYLDKRAKTLEVQGLTTYEQIVDYTLPHDLLPTITPELKHITVGGVTVGIGIESNCYRYGFVHDGLIEADVLLSDGRIVTCTATNEYADLFHGLPNSYGTLGYILRAKIKLHKVTQLVELNTVRLGSIDQLLTATKKALNDARTDYIEAIIYTPQEHYLTTSRHIKTGKPNTTVYGSSVFYQQISRPNKLILPTKEYIFRYDPEWFWNLPETRVFNLYRRLAPTGLRNSGFFTRYNMLKAKITKRKPNDLANRDLEQFIQDWEVPWDEAKGLLQFALNEIDMEWRPWLLTIIKTPAKATCYPMISNQPYINLGAYSFARKKPGKPAYYNTKIMDEYCFAHHGIKMLYSSTFVSEKDFDRIYNGRAYRQLKKKYDAMALLPTVYDKTVKAK